MNMKRYGVWAGSLEWCWPDFLATNDPLLPWAHGVLISYVQEGDNAPSCLKQFDSVEGRNENETVSKAD